jgi:OOP family OmpA-OmpF porin
MDEQDRESSLGMWVALILAIATALTVAIGTALWKKGGARTGAATATAATAAAPADAASRTPSFGRLAIIRADGRVTLEGEVSDERTKERILSKARLVFGADNVVDRISIASGAPALWWKARPLDVMSKLNAIPAFALRLQGDSATLEGAVGSEEARASLAKWLSDNLADGTRFTSNLKSDGSVRAVAYDPGALLAENIEFATGSAEIPPQHHPRLDEIARALVEDRLRVRVVGHTDNTGTPDGNLVLSRERAESVCRYLIGRGVPSADLVPEGVGQSQPIASNDTPEGRQLNRRIAFVL